MKRPESRGHQSSELQQNPSDTPGSHYHTAQNTPDMQWDNNNNRHHHQAQQVVVQANTVVAGLERETAARTTTEMVARTKTETVMRTTTELGLRMSEVVFCLVSASIMATDRTQGWAGDSFDRYKEYRYCLSVNVIGCVYSGFQACEKAYQLVSAKNKRFFTPNLRSLFDYLMDQASVTD